jgi:hypothetical protein
MQPESEKQPIRSRRALAGESAVTDTAVGEERIFGFQPRDQPRPAEQAEQVDDKPVEQISDSAAAQPWLPPQALPRDPDKDAAARHHWLNWPDS